MNAVKKWRRNTASTTGRQIFNKVPAVTVYFWIIKILCTTVGETAADFLNTNLHLGLTGTTIVIASLLIIALIFQITSKEYIPGIYWLVVVLISIVGTLITDNLTDNIGVSLETTTIVFGCVLVVVFVAWYISEKTLSVHTIYTVRREAFYWLTILFTFALGTAAGDLVAEKFQLGYLVSALLFGTIIAVIAVIHLCFRFHAVLAFWLAYILTRPLGASIGDYLSQSHDDGGLGLGTVLTSTIFLIAIITTVISLTVTNKGATASTNVPLTQPENQNKAEDELISSFHMEDSSKHH